MCVHASYFTSPSSQREQKKENKNRYTIPDRRKKRKRKERQKRKEGRKEEINRKEGKGEDRKDRRKRTPSSESGVFEARSQCRISRIRKLDRFLQRGLCRRNKYNTNHPQTKRKRSKTATQKFNKSARQSLLDQRNADPAR